MYPEHFGVREHVARRWLILVATLLITSSASAAFRVETGQTDDANTAPALPAAETPVVVAQRSNRAYATLIEFKRSLDTHRAAQPDTKKVSEPAITRPRKDSQTVAVRTVRADARGDGLTALAAGQTGRAEMFFRSMVAGQTGNAEGWLFLSRALAAQGRDKEAEQTLVTGLTRVSDSAPVARALAHRLLVRGAVAEALRTLQAYRPAATLDAEHEAFMAALQQRLGQHDLAAERYRSLLAIRPRAADWWVGLGISEEARGRADAALNAYQQARDIGNLKLRLADYAEQRIAIMQGSEQT